MDKETERRLYFTKFDKINHYHYLNDIVKKTNYHEQIHSTEIVKHHHLQGWMTEILSSDFFSIVELTFTVLTELENTVRTWQEFPILILWV